MKSGESGLSWTESDICGGVVKAGLGTNAETLRINLEIIQEPHNVCEDLNVNPLPYKIKVKWVNAEILTELELGV